MSENPRGDFFTHAVEIAVMLYYSLVEIELNAKKIAILYCFWYSLTIEVDHNILKVYRNQSTGKLLSCQIQDGVHDGHQLMNLVSGHNCCHPVMSNCKIRI